MYTALYIHSTTYYAAPLGTDAWPTWPTRHHMHSTQYTILYHARSTQYNTISYTEHTIRNTISYTKYTIYKALQYGRHRKVTVLCKEWPQISKHLPMALQSDRVGIETQLHVFLGVNFDMYDGTSRNSRRKVRQVRRSCVCTPGLALLISRSHVEGGVRDGGVWLDGEGVGQGRRPDCQGRYYVFINIFYEHINSKYICGL